MYCDNNQYPRLCHKSQSPLRRSSMNDFDVAKIKIYLQSAKQFSAFFEKKDIQFYEDTFVNHRESEESEG